jgi:tetratricopeptide (TPR) repeat protein
MASVPLFTITLALACASLAATADDLRSAHDRQDRAALDRAVREAAGAAAKQPKDAGAHFRLAEAESYLAEVDLELRDKAGAKAAAEAGIRAAERAVALQPAVAEHHRILGTLCGQVIPAQVVLAFKYGRCARASIERALEIDPRSSKAHLSRGVGDYYLPSAFGGGIELAIRDFRKAVELDPRSAEAHLWLGVALRKARRNAEARKEILKSLELNPNRIWARQQLDKTPAQ